MKHDPIHPVLSDEGALPPGVRELRRFLRRDVKAKGVLRHGRRRYPVRVDNLSEQGCQFFLPLKSGLFPGESVTLRIESLGPFEATVRWYREGWAGIEFDLPVYAPVLEHLHVRYDKNR